MLRRNFIGSVVGVLAGTQIPFKAEQVTLAPPVVGLLGKAKQVIRLMESPEEALYRCRVFIGLNNGVRIWAPGIEKVTREIDSALTISWRANAIKIKQTMIMVCSGVVDDLGRFVKEGKFGSPVHVTKGDQMISTYSFSLGWPP